jgi:hypothetical protein
MRFDTEERIILLTGIQIYHNYVSQHIEVEGKTPAEAAEIGGENKWATIIQNFNKANDRTK